MHPALSALVVFIYNLRCSTSFNHHLNMPHLLGIRRNTVQGVMQEHRRSYEALLLQSALVLRSLAFCRGSLLLATLLSLLTCPVIACLNQLSSLIHVGSQGHAIFVEEALCLRLYSSKNSKLPPYAAYRQCSTHTASVDILIDIAVPILTSIGVGIVICPSALHMLRRILRG